MCPTVPYITDYMILVLYLLTLMLFNVSHCVYLHGPSQWVKEDLRGVSFIKAGKSKVRQLYVLLNKFT